MSVVRRKDCVTLPSMSATRLHASFPDWDRIHTVLVDMDGTLLDLRFDNYFWLEYLPQHYGQIHGMTLQDALQELQPRFAAFQGTLQWYCTDPWSRGLGLNIP